MKCLSTPEVISPTSLSGGRGKGQGRSALAGAGVPGVLGFQGWDVQARSRPYVGGKPRPEGGPGSAPGSSSCQGLSRVLSSFT